MGLACGRSIMVRRESIVQRSGLLTIEKITGLFGFNKKETFLKHWNSGEPIIRDLDLKLLGKSYVADEKEVFRILERFKESLKSAIPKWRNEISRD